MTLQASAPKKDKTYANQLKSAEILERLFKQNPEHPGVAHYLVHAYDYPPLATRASTSRAATLASRRRRRTPGTCPRTSTRWSGCGKSRSRRTARRCRSSPSTTTPPTSSSTRSSSSPRTRRPSRWSMPWRRCRSQEYPILADFTAVAVIPARYALERGDWAGAAALPVSATGRAHGRFADPLRPRSRHGAQRRPGRGQAGDRRRCRSCATALRSPGSPTGPIAPRSRSWRSRPGSPRGRDAEQAVKLMRAAADGEDGSVKHVAMENRLYPMRELLGELLLEISQATAAQREFESSLKENPNRYRGLLGAARAAEAAGDRAKAAELLREARGADRARRHPTARAGAREGLPPATLTRDPTASPPCMGLGARAMRMMVGALAPPPYMALRAARDQLYRGLTSRHPGSILSHRGERQHDDARGSG